MERDSNGYVCEFQSGDLIWQRVRQLAKRAGGGAIHDIKTPIVSSSKMKEAAN